MIDSSVIVVKNKAVLSMQEVAQSNISVHGSAARSHPGSTEP